MERFGGLRMSVKILPAYHSVREIGYSHMLLDTLPFLQSAVKMYKAYGFYEIPCYNNSPMDSSIYMKLDL